MKRLFALLGALPALAASVLPLPAVAQSPSYTPTAREIQQARANAARDRKLADDMEKARLKEEAKPVAAYIPKQEKVREEKTPKLRQPEVFMAGVPGSKPAKTSKKPKDSKKD